MTCNIGALNAADSAITRSDKTFTIFYNNDESPISPIVQKQVVTITATSGSSTKQGTFVLNFESPCEDKDLVTITAMPQTGVIPSSDLYTGIDMIFTYNAYTVSPSYCNLTIKCKTVSPVNVNLPCQEIVTNGKLIWNFTPEDYTQKRVAPGLYVFTFDVTTSEGDTDLTQSFDVTVTLVDPCVSPTFTVPNS